MNGDKLFQGATERMVAVTHPCIHPHNKKSPGWWLTVDGQRWGDALWAGRGPHLRERLMAQKSQMLGSGKEGQFIHNNGRWDSNGQTGSTGEQDIKNAANSTPSGWGYWVVPLTTHQFCLHLSGILWGCLFAETQPSYSRNFQLATCLVLLLFVFFFFSFNLLLSQSQLLWKTSPKGIHSRTFSPRHAMESQWY